MFYAVERKQDIIPISNIYFPQAGKQLSSGKFVFAP